MLLIGLTGSISTGKSTCSKLLSSPPHCLPVIDTDQLARDAVSPTDPLGKAGYDAIAINRPVLGKRVFGTDSEKQRDRAILNKIIHPIVRKMMFWSIFQYWWSGHWAVVLDVPLLFESGSDLFCGGVIVVGMKDTETQIQRLLARDRKSGGTMTREDAEHRVKSQMPILEKVERVEKCWSGSRKGYVVWNDGTREELALQLGEVVGRFKKGRGPFYTELGVAMPVWTAMRALLLWIGNWWRKRQYMQEQQKLKAKI
ncbi:dephospho-CoA kinase-domain-containing protein [Kalaharituber pfeilii]|nr:dephospho-CoA kinase-domain-containing protein [Kalaharituber pfeilii]